MRKYLLLFIWTMLCLNVFYYNFDNIYFVLPLGMLTSVTNFASSVSRNMDRLSFDETHMERQEERRRHQPDGISSGLRQGLTGFGLSLLGLSTPWTIFFFTWSYQCQRFVGPFSQISLFTHYEWLLALTLWGRPCTWSQTSFTDCMLYLYTGAVAGLADQPIQNVIQSENSSEREARNSPASGIVRGMGKGILGVFTKPLGGAAELVSQTGQGLYEENIDWCKKYCIVDFVSSVNISWYLFRTAAWYWVSWWRSSSKIRCWCDCNFSSK